jgi:hypothetical protein
MESTGRIIQNVKNLTETKEFIFCGFCQPPKRCNRFVSLVPALEIFSHQCVTYTYHYRNQRRPSQLQVCKNLNLVVEDLWGVEVWFHPLLALVPDVE